AENMLPRKARRCARSKSWLAMRATNVSVPSSIANFLLSRNLQAPAGALALPAKLQQRVSVYVDDFSAPKPAVRGQHGVVAVRVAVQQERGLVCHNELQERLEAFVGNIGQVVYALGRRMRHHNVEIAPGM